MKRLISCYLNAIFSVLGLAILIPSMALAAEKACKDHPFFTRMNGYEIDSCEKKFDRLLIKYDEDPESPKNQKEEGDRTFIVYRFSDSTGTAPSYLQVLRNYQNAAKPKGGTILVEHSRYTAMKFTRESGTVYASIEVFNEGNTIELSILEQKAMTQEISANFIWDNLQKDGFVALQINFDELVKSRFE
jgi:hypothetical protein